MVFTRVSLKHGPYRPTQTYWNSTDQVWYRTQLPKRNNIYKISFLLKAHSRELLEEKLKIPHRPTQTRIRRGIGLGPIPHRVPRKRGSFYEMNFPLKACSRELSGEKLKIPQGPTENPQTECGIGLSSQWRVTLWKLVLGKFQKKNSTYDTDRLKIHRRNAVLNSAPHE